MNFFRLLGDLCHLFAIIWLPLKIWKTRSCSVVSGKSQLLYLLVFISRYLDLFTNFVSYYNTFLKIFFIAATAGTAILIYKHQLHDLIMTKTFKLICQNVKNIFYQQYDSFRIELLIIPCLILALAINHEFSVMEILWTFSIYLEAVTLIPQLVMVIKSGETEAYIVLYINAIALYRGLYILNWIYRYNYEGFYDVIAIVSGCVETVVNTGISVYVLKVYRSQKLPAYKLGNYLSKEAVSGLTGEKTEQKIKEGVCEKEIISGPSGQTDQAHNAAMKLEHIIDI